MRVLDHVVWGRARLTQAGIAFDQASFDAELLARHVLGWDRAAFVARRVEEPPPAFAEQYLRVLTRRARREPVAFITGGREFWGLDFEITPDVLVPRPETELLVELARSVCAHRPPALAADVGTGSGCLAVVLAREFPDARVIATDVSGAALAVARRNSIRHGVAERVRFLRADVLEAVGAEFDLIVSNPPYVPAGEAGTLQPDVRDYEPARALYAGPDGLDLIRRLIDQAPRRLRGGGWLLFEFGAAQQSDVRGLLGDTSRWASISFADDLQGLPRVAAAQRSFR